MRPNTLQPLMKVTAASYWIIRERLPTVRLSGKAITKRAMLDLQK